MGDAVDAGQCVGMLDAQHSGRCMPLCVIAHLLTTPQLAYQRVFHPSAIERHS
jgi:hypothetical protein